MNLHPIRKILSPKVVLFRMLRLSWIPLLLGQVLALPALGQLPATLGKWPEETQGLKPGIVVENVIQDPLDKSPLQRGDVLLSWSRGDARGEFRSPTDKWWLNIEQVYRGPVSLQGLSGGKNQTWTLTNSSDVRVRPNFTGVALVEYERLRALAKAGKAAQAGEQWLAMAHSLPSPPAWLPVWICYKAGAVLTEHHLWKEADRAYQEAERLAGQNLELLAPIHRYWGWSLWQRGAWAEADDHYLKILADLRKAGPDSFASTEFLNILANNARERGNYEQSRSYAQEALAVAENLDPKGYEANWARRNLTQTAFVFGDFDQAEKEALSALAFYHRIGASASASDALCDLGWVAMVRGDYSKAERYINEALTAKIRAHSDTVPALALLAGVASARGDLNRAESLFRRMLQKDESSGLNDSVVWDCLNLAEVYRDAGNFPEARRYARRALRLAHQENPQNAFSASALGLIGTTAAMQGHTKEAEKYLLQSLAVEEKLLPDAGTADDIAERLQWLGELSKRRGKYKQAERYYAKAIARLVAFAPTTKGYAVSLAGMADVIRREGHAEIAAKYYERAVRVFENQISSLGGPTDIRAGFRARYGNFYAQYIDLLIREKNPELAFEILERSRARTLLETLAAARVDIRKGVDPELTAKARSLQADVKAKSDRRVHLLAEKQSEDQVKAVEREIGTLTEEYQDVEAQIRSTSPTYAALTQPQPLSAKEIQEQLLDPDTLLLEYSLGEAVSHVFVVSGDSLAAYDLPRRPAIEAAARRVYEMLTARNRRNRGEKPAERAARIARAGAEYPQAAARLSRMVLGPIAEKLGDKRLLIVSDGALYYVPFAALPVHDAGRTAPLMAQHEIVNLPSASLLAVLRREQLGRQPAAKTVAVLADPVFDSGDVRVDHAARGELSSIGELRGGNSETQTGDSAREENQAQAGLEFADGDESLALAHLTRSAADVGWKQRHRGEVYLPRLQSTRREADAIVSVTPPGQSLEALDFKANRATATNPELANYRIVHFATHALLNSKHPELSGLVLSLVDERGRPQSGFLGLEDIYNLNLPAELVVLSACETALGKDIEGEGMVGLTRGFMYAGASRVMASLWSIDDRATADQMRYFYRAMVGEGMRPAAALRAAQLKMRHDPRWRSPYFWAAFQIQGEWR